jgi:lipopolysaccharide/colanic/teichoic acid biosynthesis glycosyltransferase
MNLPRTKHARIDAVSTAGRSYRALRARTAIAREIATAAPLFIIDAAVLFGIAALTSTIAVANDGGAMLRAVPPIALTVFLLRGLYPGVALHPVDELRRLALGVTTGFAAYGVCVASLAPQLASPLAILAGWVLAMGLVPCVRWTARYVLARTSWWGCHTLLLGKPPKGSRKRLRRQGLLPVATPIEIARPDAELDLEHVDSAWIVSFGSEPPAALVARGAPAAHIGMLDASVAQVRAPCRKLRYRLMKRTVDLGVALTLLPFVAPVALMVAAAIRLTSKGPVFYHHRRLGRGGRQFSVWKFRTMAVDADKKLKDYLDNNPDLAREWIENQKLLRDPRVTPVGRILRKTSLDELPQLWNVLSGDMSLVGPRPIVEDEIPRYGPTYDAYKQVPPGVTGLWQVSGRNNTSYPERVRLDGEYVRDWSLSMDMYILMRTARTVVLTEGAS